jgi:hypothetical protein
LGILLIEKLKEVQEIPYKSPKEKEKAYVQAIDSVQTLYKYYSTSLRLQTLKEYMEKSTPDSIGRDHELVREVVRKLYAKSSRYLFDENDIVTKAYSFLANIIGKKAPLPPPFKKEEIESWIEDYRIKYNLPEEFFLDPLMHVGRD